MLKLRRFTASMVLLAATGCPDPPPLPNLPAPEYEPPRPFPGAAASALSTPVTPEAPLPEAAPEAAPPPPGAPPPAAPPPTSSARPALEPGAKP